MILDGERVTDTLYSDSPAVRAFLLYIEKKLGVSIIRPADGSSLSDAAFMPYSGYARVLSERGIARSFGTVRARADEPRMYRWSAQCGGQGRQNAGGSSFQSEKDALAACAAEALERYLWAETTDYFRNPRSLTTRDASKHLPVIAPERFAGLSQSDRTQQPDLQLGSKSMYRWIEAVSLLDGAPILIPAQTVSGVPHIREHDGLVEPVIRPRITTGLATWPTQEGARLRGALEIIERDAFMITWLNQIAAPRLALETIKSDPLARAVAACARYGLTVHALSLPTDAPAHVICVVLEDVLASAPRYTIGLKAGGDIAACVLSALEEALRARDMSRTRSEAHESAKSDVNEIGHIDRLDYWAVPEHAEALSHMISGPDAPPAELGTQSERDLLARIVTWCGKNGYAIAAVSLGSSMHNPLPWAVEMVVIPELQPLYIHERRRLTAGARISEIPRRFGYTPLPEPYTAAPHPFV